MNINNKYFQIYIFLLIIYLLLEYKYIELSFNIMILLISLILLYLSTQKREKFANNSDSNNSQDIITQLSSVYNNGQISTNNIVILDTANVKQLIVNKKNFNNYLDELKTSISDLKNELDQKIDTKANKSKPYFTGPVTISHGKDYNDKYPIIIDNNNDRPTSLIKFNHKGSMNSYGVWGFNSNGHTTPFAT